MTKKDFILIARVVQSLHRSYESPIEQRRYTAETFADELEKINPRFNRDRFVDACTGDEVPWEF
jgi:hypothetical protein